MSRFGVRRGIGAAVLVLVIVGMAVVASGCGGKADASGGPVKLTEAENGKAITVKVGDIVQVVLAGNSTTGYAWTTALSDKDKAVLQQKGEAIYAQGNTNPSVVGAGGTFTFNFKAAAAGQVSLKLGYARSFEQGVAPIQTFAVTITVK